MMSINRDFTRPFGRFEMVSQRRPLYDSAMTDRQLAILDYHRDVAAFGTSAAAPVFVIMDLDDSVGFEIASFYQENLEQKRDNIKDTDRAKAASAAAISKLENALLFGSIDDRFELPYNGKVARGCALIKPRGDNREGKDGELCDVCQDDIFANCLQVELPNMRLRQRRCDELDLLLRAANAPLRRKLESPTCLLNKDRLVREDGRLLD